MADVAVKKLRAHASEADRKDFKREIDNMINIKHPFIVWFGSVLCWHA